MKKTKIKKVTIEYEDHIRTIEGSEAKKWQENVDSMAVLSHVHNMNPFDSDPVKWVIKNQK